MKTDVGLVKMGCAKFGCHGEGEGRSHHDKDPTRQFGTKMTITRRCTKILAQMATEEPRLTEIEFRGRHLSYQRGRRTTHPKTSLIKIEGVDDTDAAK